VDLYVQGALPWQYHMLIVSLRRGLQTWNGKGLNQSRPPPSSCLPYRRPPLRLCTTDIPVLKTPTTRALGRSGATTGISGPGF